MSETFRWLAPRFWFAHLLGLAAVSVTVSLGLWQMDGWQAAREAEAIDVTHDDPVPLADLIGPDDPFPAPAVGRPVTVSGTWVPDGTVYVEGKEHDDTDGYWVVTPLAVTAADDPALLVVRGWSPTVEDAPPPPQGAGELVAWLQPPDGSLVTDEDPTDDVLPQVRIADAIQHVDQDLYGAYGVLNPDAPHTNAGDDALAPADLAQLPKSGNFTALRNFLYAIEWWVFTAFVLFVWWRWVRDALREPDTEPGHGDEDTDDTEPESAPSPDSVG